MTDLTFHRTLVEPFYLHFLAANIAREPADQARSVLALFKRTLPEYSTTLLQEMLASAWRRAKVAAWVIAAQRRAALVPEVCRRLLAQPSHVEHFCIALARVNDERPRGALLSYLGACADGTLHMGAWDESVDPDWALAAIEVTGSPAGSRKTAGEEAWQRFLVRQNEGLRRCFVQRLPLARALLRDTLRLLEEHFG